MKDQYIENIRKACIEANPEIVELKFGCALKIIDEHFANSKSYPLSKYGDFEYKILTVTTDPNVFLILAKFGIEYFNWKEIDRFCEILGRQIRLADVLLAIERQKKITVLIDSLGCFMTVMPGEQPKFISALNAQWNLPTDDLTLQDEPTLKFINDLLTTTK